MITCEGCGQDTPEPGSDLLPRLCRPCFAAAIPGWIRDARQQAR